MEAQILNLYEQYWQVVRDGPTAATLVLAQVLNNGDGLINAIVTIQELCRKENQ